MSTAGRRSMPTTLRRFMSASRVLRIPRSPQSIRRMVTLPWRAGVSHMENPPRAADFAGGGESRSHDDRSHFDSALFSIRLDGQRSDKQPGPKPSGGKDSEIPYAIPLPWRGRVDANEMSGGVG